MTIHELSTMSRYCPECLKGDSVTFSSSIEFYPCSKCNREICIRHISGICHKCKEIYCDACLVPRSWFDNVHVCDPCWKTLVGFNGKNYYMKYKDVPLCAGNCTSWAYDIKRCLKYEMKLIPL